MIAAAQAATAQQRPPWFNASPRKKAAPRKRAVYFFCILQQQRRQRMHKRQRKRQQQRGRKRGGGEAYRETAAEKPPWKRYQARQTGGGILRGIWTRARRASLETETAAENRKIKKAGKLLPVLFSTFLYYSVFFSCACFRAGSGVPRLSI